VQGRLLVAKFIFTGSTEMTRPIIQIHDVSTGETVVREMNDAEFADWQAVQPTEAQQADAVRSERNARLTASDWTQVADAPVDKAEWATYRQALRDISAQEGFPNTVEWPTQPEI
jgi:hypothetical protein